jgi:hypothetical protein
MPPTSSFGTGKIVFRNGHCFDRFGHGTAASPAAVSLGVSEATDIAPAIASLSTKFATQIRRSGAVCRGAGRNDAPMTRARPRVRNVSCRTSGFCLRRLALIEIDQVGTAEEAGHAGSCLPPHLSMGADRKKRVRRDKTPLKNLTCSPLSTSAQAVASPLSRLRRLLLLEFVSRVWSLCQTL